MAISTDEQNNLPLVSVITPTYNRPHYLKEALVSALGQTYSNIEIIVSDNCSPEDPRSLIESFADGRIRFFRNSANLGMFTNTMNALKMAQGKYVAFLLDDDLWEPDFLEKLIPPLEKNPDLALAFCDHYVIDADSRIDEEKTREYSRRYKRADLQEGIYQPFYELALVQRAVSSATAAVMRRELINPESIPPEVGGSWDIYLNYLCCRTGMGAYFYPGKLTRYRDHEQTDTNQSGTRNYQAKIRKAQADMFCYGVFMDDERLSAYKAYFQKQCGFVSTSLGIGLMRSQQLMDARSCLWKSLHQQFSLRTAAALFLSFVPAKIAARF